MSIIEMGHVRNKKGRDHFLETDRSLIAIQHHARVRYWPHFINVGFFFLHTLQTLALYQCFCFYFNGKSRKYGNLIHNSRTRHRVIDLKRRENAKISDVLVSTTSLIEFMHLIYLGILNQLRPKQPCLGYRQFFVEICEHDCATAKFEQLATLWLTFLRIRSISCSKL